MAGLLKQLQRQKGKSEAEERGAVVRSTARDLSEQDLLFAEGELLLDSGFTDNSTESLSRGRDTSVHGLYRDPVTGVPTSQRPESEKSDTGSRKLRSEFDETPWWLTEEQKGNAQVDTLVLAVLKEFSLEGVDWANESLLKNRLRELLERRAHSVKDEIRVTRKLIEQTEQELLKLVFGKGPLEPLFEDSSVTDIFVDSHKSVKVLRAGHAIETPFTFRGEEEYRFFIGALLHAVHQTIDATKPIVDCVLNDKWHSRINVIDGSIVEAAEPRICFRIPRLQAYSFFDILQTKTLPATVAAWLAELTALREANILVVGPRGSGRTVMMTALVSAVGSDERIVTLEDDPEIYVANAQVEKLIALPGHVGETSVSSLLEVALRRSPHRIVLGELKGEEIEPFLQVLERGVSGSMATMTAENAEDALERFLDFIAARSRASEESLRRRIARSLHLILTMKNTEGGPCLQEIAEVKPGSFRVQPILRFLGTVKGKRQWQLLTRSSRWLDTLKERGLVLHPGPSLLAPPAESETSGQQD